MATQKGAKVTKVVTNELILSIKGPGGAPIEFSPIEADDDTLIASLIETAEQYERGGIEYSIIRKETQVRTQVSEIPVTIDELKNPNEEPPE